jgi:alpha-tubulin suppressor-like RCC1 family protein
LQPMKVKDETGAPAFASKDPLPPIAEVNPRQGWVGDEMRNRVVQILRDKAGDLSAADLAYGILSYLWIAGGHRDAYLKVPPFMGVPTCSAACDHLVALVPSAGRPRARRRGEQTGQPSREDMMLGAMRKCLVECDTKTLDRKCLVETEDVLHASECTRDGTTYEVFPAVVRDVGPPTENLTGARSVSSGGSYTCALMADRAVQCWGHIDSTGALGDGSVRMSHAAEAVAGLIDPISVSAGAAHACSVLANGTVRCWGHNQNGQLGDGTTKNSPGAVEVLGLSDVTAVSAGAFHTCAILTDGRVQCWGLNSTGQLGNGSTTDSTRPFPTSEIVDASSIASSNSYTCAVLKNGTAKCWGSNSNGQLGNGTKTSSLEPVPVVGLTSATAVSTGGGFSCTTTSDGTVRCWGRWSVPGNGSLSDSLVPVAVIRINGFRSLSAGRSHACVVLLDGATRCWGENGHGQLGNNTSTDSRSPVAVSDLAGAVQVSAGGDHSCALLESGSVYCWGDNGRGGLGDDTMIDSCVPVQVRRRTNQPEPVTHERRGRSR